jgi:orotate phosphoribosyltransferase
MSSEYFDKYLFESRPEMLKDIARGLRALIPAGTELLAGLEMGGIPVATALSLETGLASCSCGKKPNPTGQESWRRAEIL